MRRLSAPGKGPSTAHLFQLYEYTQSQISSHRNLARSTSTVALHRVTTLE